MIMGGRSREELCAKRDKLLFQVLRATKDLINERIRGKTMQDVVIEKPAARQLVLWRQPETSGCG